MPELPEVEYVRRMLLWMRGGRIRRVLTRRAALRYPLGTDFVRRLEGQKVLDVRRRAKYLLVSLGSGDTLVVHLGMSGWFQVRGPANRTRRRVPFDASRLDVHDHVIFEMADGTVVVYNDPRRFGFMKVVSPFETLPAIAALGPEPLGEGFTADVLAARVKGKRKASLKAVLIDQRVVAGVGNIYACEALHRARLSPRRRASALRPDVALRLADAIRAVLNEAIARGHRAGSGDRFRVYDREGQRCRRRACPGVVRRIVQAGRSTFYCPVCQT